jgi:hypothetical protein
MVEVIEIECIVRAALVVGVIPDQAKLSQGMSRE